MFPIRSISIFFRKFACKFQRTSNYEWIQESRNKELQGHRPPEDRRFLTGQRVPWTEQLRQEHRVGMLVVDDGYVISGFASNN